MGHHVTEPSPDVIITSGGTREQIDDVRYVSNMATGELGHHLAEVYVGLGYQVLLLAAPDVLQRFGRLDGVEHQEFTTADSLRHNLLRIPDARLVLQAAAISDYTPVTAPGKISSEQDELIIRMQRTPKILPELRVHFGPDTTLVGFKLLSGSAEADLIDVASKQIQTCQTDYCVANDLQAMGSTRRIHIVARDGTYQTFEGSAADLAVDIAKTIPNPLQ